MSAASDGADSSGDAGAEHDDVDVERLTDLVYRLFVADVRIGLARGESVGRRSGSESVA